MIARGLTLLTLLILFACNHEPSEKTMTGLELKHDYPDSVKDRNSPEPAKVAPIPDTKVEGDNMYTLYRDLWQNPIKVIQQMGDLKGKTVADIGAGPYGYFSLQLAARSDAGKILALDIDDQAIDYIENAKKLLPKEIAEKIETRKVKPNDPLLEKGEADIVLIVNTAPYFDDRVAYFKNLLNSLSPDGMVVVIDFKKRYTRGAGPPIDSRVTLGDMEEDLRAAGYRNIRPDDRTLEYQYIITATGG